MPIRGPHIRQHANHDQLIGHAKHDPAAADDCPPLDAIVVPASRPAHNLDHAITLARAAKSHLVILCSHATRPAEIHELLAARSFSATTVVEIPTRYSHEFFAFETTEWIRKKLPAVCAVRDSDLSVKRNVGLVLARMLGWRRIFFMDDDIRDLDAAMLRSTVSLLAGDDRYYSAGMSADEFPDNSVVCHARRAVGEFQGVFVSGSALAVDCTVPFAFFPDIYNEDWLFFYRDAVAGRLGHSGHFATQLRYEPFADPQRAAGQEFGDVIAEGLYALLEDGLGTEQATAERWEEFLADRERILGEILEQSDRAPRHIQADMRMAVRAALRCLRQIQPDMCLDYVQRWRRDVEQWERTLGWLPQADSITDALLKLGLTPTAAETRHGADRCTLEGYHEYFVGLAVGMQGAAECGDSVELVEVSRGPQLAASFALVGFTNALVRFTNLLVVDPLVFLRLELRRRVPDPPYPPMLTWGGYRLHVVVEVGPKHVIEVFLPKFGDINNVTGCLDGETPDVTSSPLPIPFGLDLDQVPGRRDREHHFTRR